MRDNIRRIIETLDHKNQIILSLQRQAVNMLNEQQSPDQFIARVKDERENYGDCLGCNGQPFCRFFLAFAHLKLGEIRLAKLLVQEAIDGFSLRGLHWNEAISHWLLGMIRLQEGESGAAEHSMLKALEILVPLSVEFRIAGNYERAAICGQYIEQIRNTQRYIPDNAKLERASTGSSTAGSNQVNADFAQSSSENETQTTAPQETSSSIAQETASASNSALSSEPMTVSTEEPIVENEIHLTFPWIPIYKGFEVEAGLNGPIRPEREIKERSELANVYMEGERYAIYPVRKGDNRVTLSTDKHYGWVKVHGQSMNRANPTRIQEGDYVLFYESSWPDNNAIVIVSKADSSFIENGSSYIVKRYLKEQQQLKSETSMKGDEYEPVTITENHRCLGVVIAVALLRI